MATRTIRAGLSCAAACALFSILFASSAMNAEGPARIDMLAVIRELSVGSIFRYSFISADRLRQGTIEWQRPIPAQVRDMWSLGTENLLVLSEAEFPGDSRYSKLFRDTISIFDPRGSILAQRPLGDYQLKDVRQSHNGSLVNVRAENDHDVLNIVTDFKGSSFLQIGYHAVLLPSWDGEYLIDMSARGSGKASRLVVDAGGRETEAAAARLINKDGSIREPGIASEFEEASKGVLWAFDNDELLFSGCERGDRDCALTLYDARAGRTIWTREITQPMSLEAVCHDSARTQDYVLMNATANERGVTSFVLARTEGSIISETFGSIVHGSIGSSDGYFYSVFSEEPRFEQRPKHWFVLKHTPEFAIESFGVLCDFHSLHSMRLRGDYLYGIFENCQIDGRNLRRVTAIFDMGKSSTPSGKRGHSMKCVVPVLLEGIWHIRDISASTVELIGQLDPEDGQLTKITIQRSWLD
ncbi:MAG: hypothetical protein PHD74_08850 [Candidatus Krumholzibacteria bacterium]|nr:hypothetical protein [Candidatus Krumholzibacteria bacterium]